MGSFLRKKLVGKVVKLYRSSNFGAMMLGSSWLQLLGGGHCWVSPGSGGCRRRRGRCTIWTGLGGRFLGSVQLFRLLGAAAAAVLDKLLED